MQDYREQESEGRISTPGGLEHMGDVGGCCAKWDAALSKERNEKTIPPPTFGGAALYKRRLDFKGKILLVVDGDLYS